MSFFNLTQTGLQNPLKTATDFEAAPEPIPTASPAASPAAPVIRAESDPGLEEENTHPRSPTPAQITTSKIQQSLEQGQDVHQSQKPHTSKNRNSHGTSKLEYLVLAVT